MARIPVCPSVGLAGHLARPAQEEGPDGRTEGHEQARSTECRMAMLRFLRRVMPEPVHRGALATAGGGGGLDQAAIEFNRHQIA